MQKEIWKDVPEYEGYYQVSNLGRVKSLERKSSNNHVVDEKIRKLRLNQSGYYRVNLSKNNEIRTYQVHVLIAITFLNHKPNRYKIVVDHINNIKTDNRLENLQLITHRENASKDQFRHNRTSKYVGVSWHKASNRWRANITINNKQVHLGIFKTEFEAHLIYQKTLKHYDNK